MNQRPRHRHPLQLAATELLRQPPPQPCQADRTQHGLHPAVVALAEQHQGQGHVLRHVQVRQHVKGLKHKADVLTPQSGQLIVRELAQIQAVEVHRTLVPGVKPSQAVQQGRLTHARLAHNGHKLAALHLQ